LGLTNPFVTADGVDAGFFAEVKIRPYTSRVSPTFERIWRCEPIGISGATGHLHNN
jgi:hypothetical protein